VFNERIRSWWKVRRSRCCCFLFSFEWKRLNWGWYYPDSGQFVDFKVTIDVEGERCSPQLFGFDNDRRNISQVSMLGILVFPLIRLDVLYNPIPALDRFNQLNFNKLRTKKQLTTFSKVKTFWM
jgi:hypothetical protein